MEVVVVVGRKKIIRRIDFAMRLEDLKIGTLPFISPAQHTLLVELIPIDLDDDVDDDEEETVKRDVTKRLRQSTFQRGHVSSHWYYST